VLFYDKNLSVNNTISCGSCHKQEFAFSDTALASSGVLGGFSSRHTMRLINTRFSEEVKFFWDERAISLEAQTTRPIQDHAEMGFSGQNGRQNINDLIIKLSAINYYQELFKFVYGTPTITEQKMQDCLASFVRSIQSYDSKFDLGRANAPNNENPFTNFTTQENLGKQLFIQPPQFDNLGNRIGGGIGCQGCHRAPEFDIDPNSKNNGMIKNLVVGGSVELAITKSPSLRDAVNATGGSNGPFMHSGVHASLQAVIGHYNNVNQVPANNNLDARLSPKGTGQNLNMTPAEISAVIAFIKTLSGTNVYKDTKWSSPF
jgi:cytochrome c peroxidase